MDLWRLLVVVVSGVVLARAIDRNYTRSTRNASAADAPVDSSGSRAADMGTADSYSDEDAFETAASEEYGYQHSHDKFVENYFADFGVGSAEQAARERPPTGRSRRKSAQHCRKVYESPFVCVVCKNAHNDETNRTCSYSRSSGAQPHAIRRHAMVKKTPRPEGQPRRRDRALADLESDMELALKSQPEYTKYTTTSPCIRKIVDRQLCFYCENNNGTKLLECFERNEPAPKKMQHQRVFKRYTAFRYDNATASRPVIGLPMELNGILETYCGLTTECMESSTSSQVL